MKFKPKAGEVYRYSYSGMWAIIEITEILTHFQGARTLYCSNNWTGTPVGDIGVWNFQIPSRFTKLNCAKSKLWKVLNE